MAKKLYYKIGEACKHLDIQPYVLRYWETEFPMLKPDKSSSGQRVYSDMDLATIRRIKELLYDEGYTIAGAKKKLDSEDLIAADGRPTLRAVESAPEEKTAEKKAPQKQAKAPAKKATAKAAPKAAPKAAKGKAKKIQAAPDAKETAGLRKGVQAALNEARGILEILDSES